MTILTLVVASPLPSTSWGCLSIDLLYHPSETLSTWLCHEQLPQQSLICTPLCTYLGLQTSTSSFLLLMLSMALGQAYSHQLLYQHSMSEWHNILLCKWHSYNLLDCKLLQRCKKLVKLQTKTLVCTTRMMDGIGPGEHILTAYFPFLILACQVTIIELPEWAHADPVIQWCVHQLSCVVLYLWVHHLKF